MQDDDPKTKALIDLSLREAAFLIHDAYSAVISDLQAVRSPWPDTVRKHRRGLGLFLLALAGITFLLTMAMRSASELLGRGGGVGSG